MRKEKFLALGLTALLLYVLGPMTANAAGETEKNVETIHWYKLAQGEKMAARQKKPLVVDFATGAGCPRCEKMGREAYKDPEVISKLNRDFIPVKVDLSRPITDEERNLGNRFDYRNDCLLLFLDYKGNPIADPIEGKLCFIDVVNAKDFIKYLDLALKNAQKTK
ncbi:MAG: DUF255 domain-containing protein [Nitrospiraceae bacterium]|nr:DUF255 domain-containing protein [Nitrospiraceae bacterium]